LSWVELFAVPAPRQHVVSLDTLRNLDLVSDIKIRERPVALWSTPHGWLKLGAERAAGGRAFSEPHAKRNRILPPHRPCREGSICRAQSGDLQVLLRAAVINHGDISDEVEWHLLEALFCNFHGIRWLLAQAVAVAATMVVVEIELDGFDGASCPLRHRCVTASEVCPAVCAVAIPTRHAAPAPRIPFRAALGIASFDATRTRDWRCSWSTPWRLPGGIHAKSRR